MRRKFLAGGVLIALALAYMIYSGATQSVVYFVTPSELLAAPVAGKAYRLGGLIMAKHSEDYQAPHDDARTGYKELIKLLPQPPPS